MRKITLLFTALLFSLSLMVAQDGILDTSFGNNGEVITDINDEPDYGLAFAQQPDGKTVVVGLTTINDDQQHIAVRYNEDGTLDASFGDAGVVTFNLDDSYSGFFSVNIQADGKIVAAGTINLEGDLDILVMRMLEDGTLDSTFGSNGTVVIEDGSSGERNVHLKEDGTIFIAAKRSVNPGNELLFAQLLPNGNLDTSFGNNGMVITNFNYPYINLSSSQLLDDGGFLVSARRWNANQYLFLVAKFSEQGVWDESFGEGGFIETSFVDTYMGGTIALDHDGKIIVGIRIGEYDNWIESSFSRYFADGTIDNTFGNNGKIYLPNANITPSKVIVQENGRLLVLGNYEEFEAGRLVILRLHANGNLDNSFGVDGFPTSSFTASDMLIQNDGKILGLGYTWWFDGDEEIKLVRYQNNPLGTEDLALEDFQVYPNPSSNIFILKSKNLLLLEENYQVVDITGKVVLQGQMLPSTSLIDLSNAQAGVYFLKVANQTFRLIKE